MKAGSWSIFMVVSHLIADFRQYAQKVKINLQKQTINRLSQEKVIHNQNVMF